MYPMPHPPNPFPEGVLQTAYQRCLAVEAIAPDLEPVLGCPPPLVCARLLGHLLRLAPVGNGRRRVQEEISLAVDDSQLMEVARTYFNGLIRIFKRERSGDRTPMPRSASSRSPESPFDGADVVEYTTSETATPAPVRGDQLDHRKALDGALRRSDYCCMLTRGRCFYHGGSEFLRAVHIIPERTKMHESGEKRKFRAAGEWAMLSMFTGNNLASSLAGDKIHCLENIVLMNISCHPLFDNLSLWFKPVEGHPHTYGVHSPCEKIRECQRIPQTITFTTKTDLPLPDGTYLALHALCCEVAWMSGAVEYLWDIERRKKETHVLANDGSTADLLASELAHILLR